MGHLMSTINPQAVERVEERPLPDIGDIVHYYPRPGERRRGRDKVSALVVHRDERNRRLDLAIFHEATDVLDQQNVPERVGDDRGWLRKADTSGAVNVVQVHHDAAELAAIKGEIAAIKDEQARIATAIFGDIPPPKESVLEMLGILDTAIEEIEAKFTAAQTAAATPSPVTFKRRGRPPKNAPPKVA